MSTLRNPLVFFLLLAQLGFSVQKASAAEVFFNEVYKGIGATYGIETQNITISSATKITGTSFSFVSYVPGDPLFSGNNVLGYLKYLDGSNNLITIRGVISRPEKSGSNYRGFYFYASDVNEDPTGEAYLIVIPGNEAVFPGTGDIGTSSDPIDKILNGLLGQPLITVDATLTPFSSCSGSPSSSQTILVEGSGLTANISISAPTGYELSLSSASGYSGSITLTATGGTVSSTTIYVRLKADASTGAGGNLTFNSSGAPQEIVIIVAATINPLPTITITPSNPVMTSYSGVSLTASGAYSYVWSPATGLSSTTTSTVTATPSSTVTYTVTGTTLSGCSSTASVVVTYGIVPLDAGSVGSSQTICSGTAPATLTSISLASGGYGNIVYTWQSSIDDVTFTNISGANSVTYTASNLSTNTYFRRESTDDDGVNSSTSSILITVIAVPAQPVFSNAPSKSIAGAIKTFSVTPVSGATSYTWTLPNGWSGTSSTTSITVTVGTLSGTVTVIANKNSCSSIEASIAVRIVPDFDGDGFDDEDDLDDDNDGILDTYEDAICSPSSSLCDTDGDSVPNKFDLDSDGDGIYDVYEANGIDVNKDGVSDGVVDSNGVPVSANGGLTPPDTDTDAKSDPYDVDSDGDGIPDVDEAGPDPKTPVDSDNDGIPDFREIDSDDEGIPDGETLLIYKSSSQAVMQSDGSLIMKFSIVIKNNRDVPLTTLLVKDNLSSTFPSPIQFRVLDLVVSGSLVKNSGYDGRTDIDLLTPASFLTGYGIDSINFTVRVEPNGYSGPIRNTGDGSALSKWGPVNRQSIDLSQSNGRRHGAGIPTFTLLPNVNIFIADALTPNQDGINDTWIIVRPASVKINVKVFNRWGQIVYRNDDYQNDWSGRGVGNFLGRELPHGSYFYVVDIVNRTTGAKDVRKGSILITRDF